MSCGNRKHSVFVVKEVCIRMSYERLSFGREGMLREQYGCFAATETVVTA